MSCAIARLGLLVLAAAALAACSIDRVEWETSGFPVDEARHALEEEHHVAAPVVECIQREVQGAVWECRAHADGEEYECTVHVGIRHEIHSLHCEPEHEEGVKGGSGDEAHGDEEGAPAEEAEDAGH
jgi:hypothetical protein